MQNLEINSIPKIEFQEIFRGLTTQYGKFLGYKDEPKKDGKRGKKIASVPAKPPYADHLAGYAKIGIYPFASNNEVYWGCIDVDEYTNPKLHQELQEKIKNNDLPFLHTRSSNGGGHLWVLFEKPVRADQLRIRLKSIATTLELGKVDIFPAQDSINMPKYMGNFVFIPYDGPDSLSYAFKEDGVTALTLEEFEQLAAQKVLKNIKGLKVDKLEAPVREPVADNLEYLDGDLMLQDFMPDGPPCLNSLSKTGIEKNRNEAMFSFAVLSKKAKGKAVLEDLITANEFNTPPLKTTELKPIMNSVNKGEYFYKCKTEPLLSKCNKQLCLMQKFGIGGDTSYYEDYVFVKQSERVIKLRPQIVDLTLSRAKNIMTSDQGKLPRGRQMLTAGEIWHTEISKKNSVDVMTWNPGKPRYYTEPGDDGEVVTIINTYRPTTLKPVAGNDIEVYLDFITKRIKEPVANKYYHQRMAQLIQHPGIRCPSNMLLVSDYGGTGKSIIDIIMQELLGPWNCSSPNLDDLLQGWGQFTKNKLYVSVEEIHTSGSDRGKISSVIKRLTSIKRSTNNMKYGDITQDEMFCNFKFDSNSNTAITVKTEDRRNFVYKYDNDGDEFKESNVAEAKVLMEWCEKEQGFGKILHYYQNLDLTDFDVFGWPPITDAKLKMILKTSDFKFKKLYEAYEDSRAPFFAGCEVFCPNHLADLIDMDRDDLLKNMKQHLGIIKLIRVQNVGWIYKSENANYEHGEGVETLQLWTTNPDIKIYVDMNGPREALKHYLHPVHAQSGYKFVQDRNYKGNLVREFKEKALGLEKNALKENQPF